MSALLKHERTSTVQGGNVGMRHKTNQYANNKTMAKQVAYGDAVRMEYICMCDTYVAIFIGSNVFVADFMVYKSGYAQTHTVTVLLESSFCCGAV